MYTNSPFLHMRKASYIENLHDLLVTLTPGRYVGIEDEEDDDVSFEEKMEKYSGDLFSQLEQSHMIDNKILKILGDLVYEL